MKFRYKPPYNDEVVEFDPGTEIICPLCGAVRPVPFGWKTHITFVWCEEVEKHATKPEFYHPALFFDINSLLGTPEFELVPYMVRKGIIFEEDFNNWHNKRTMWFIMYSIGGAPKWRVEPDPFWQKTLKEVKDEQNKIVSTRGKGT